MPSDHRHHLPNRRLVHDPHHHAVRYLLAALGYLGHQVKPGVHYLPRAPLAVTGLPVPFLRPLQRPCIGFLSVTSRMGFPT